jgi:hypothetical protein
MTWKRGELRTIALGKKHDRKKTITPAHYDIPAPYDRIVSQLIAEDLHAKTNTSHEARRQRAYARETLDAFGKELEEFRCSDIPLVDFRSKVLTPILQRQLAGIHDAYTPIVHDCLSEKEPSIQDATGLYLQVDPVDPKFIRSYRRNLLYLPEPRWHLGCVIRDSLGSGQEAIGHYDKVWKNHDAIQHSLEIEGFNEFDENKVALLSRVEVLAIIDEGLESFFKEELNKVVRE